MRLSTKIDDPGFVSGVRNVTVYLDGEPAKGVVTADEERGFIVCYARGEDGSELLKNGDLVEERKHGVVRIDLPDNHELRARWKDKESRTANRREANQRRACRAAGADVWGRGMTKPASILVAPRIDLRTVPPQDRDAVRRFLFECIRGLDSQHDKRWRRLWSRIWKSEPGEATQLLILAPRSRKFHARHMAIENKMFDAQDAFVNQDRFRDWIKTGAGFGKYTLVGERMKFVPASVSYDECSDDEMREFHENVIAFLRTPRAQRRLWPHLTAIKRSQMVDWILNEQTEHA